MNSGPWIQVALFYTFSARKSWTVLQVDENPVFKIGVAFSAVLFPFDSISILPFFVMLKENKQD